MCVAILVKSNDPIDAQDLWRMELDNPHGAGIAYPEGDRLRFIKGLRWRQILELQKRIPRPHLIHFRWATHGGKRPALTHPFVLGERAFHSALKGYADAVLIHNGVWSNYARHIPDHVKKIDVSDTQVAAYVAGTDESILDDVDWATAVGRAKGGGRMDVTLRGGWTEYRGNLYSNLSWLPYSDRPTGYSLWETRSSSFQYWDPEFDVRPTPLNADTPVERTQMKFIGSPPKVCNRCGRTGSHERGCYNSGVEVARRRRRNDDQALTQWLNDYAKVHEALSEE